MFYSPFVTIVGDKPFVCYTDTDMAKHFAGYMVEDDALATIREFDTSWSLMAGRTETRSVPEDTNFMIGFLWTDPKTREVFVDVWLNRQLETYGECGPMKTLQTFNSNGGYVDHWEKGNGCDWTNIVTGVRPSTAAPLWAPAGPLRTTSMVLAPKCPRGSSSLGPKAPTQI